MNEPGQKRYHLCGVAGVGMNALAQLLLTQGHAVSGSDRFLDEGRDLEVIRKLRGAGVQLVPQDGSGVTKDTAEVVVSTAIEADNPDLVQARQRKIPVSHRAQMLARMALGHRLVAVTGTSGKTTVTGMIGWVLECMGKDPTVVNGGNVLNWKTQHRVGNVRIGRTNLWVVEADESDRSFLHFDPEWAVITNISKDHFELPEVVSLFRTFAQRVRGGIVCGAGLSAVIRNSVGTSEAGKQAPALVEEPFEASEEGGRYGFWYKGQQFRSPLIGEHNAENAFLAVVMCDHLGLDLVGVYNALLSFQGIERRLERVGEARGIAVIDDYAHNPAKIHAAWQAVASAHKRVLGAWRPHGFGPLAAMLNELTDAFVTACRPEDRVFILPVFYAGGTANKTVTSGDLVKHLQGRGINAALAEDYDSLAASLKKEARAGDAILCMGARDPELPAFARRMVSELDVRPSG